MEKKIRLIDGHAHLDELEELENDLDEAKRAGVIAIIGVGMSLESNRRILSIAEENPDLVLPAIGYHPWEIRKTEIEDTLEFMEKHADRCIAIGEVGLDYKAKVKKALQKDVFLKVIDIATRFNKALILHCRYSHKRVLSMISEGGIEKAIFHWYVGSEDLLKEIVDAGYYISATPALAYSTPHQKAIREAPLERILLETDCPVSYQGIPSRPSDVRTTLKEVAKLKRLDLAEVASVTSTNAVALFGLKK